MERVASGLVTSVCACDLQTSTKVTRSAVIASPANPSVQRCQRLSTIAESLADTNSLQRGGVRICAIRV